MLVYVQNISPRFKYITSFLGSFYNCKINYTTKVEEYINYSGYRINYSSHSLTETELWIKPHGLLLEDFIHEVEVVCIQHEGGFKVIFPTDDDLGFDILSAIFYLLSRYEEYLPHKKDMYGRYAHENSIAFKNDLLHLPLINIWLEYLKKAIESKTGFQIADSEFHYQPTYDIDIAWSYRNKGILRNAGAMLRSLTQFNFKEVHERLLVLSGKKADPYDTYNWMEQLNQDYNLKPIYFFHVGSGRSGYDKNILPTNKQLQQLIKSLAVKNSIGLHPSWSSGDKEDEILKEKKMLEKISGIKITKSRQHYIRFTLPGTFRKLLEAGIEEDFSMGYGSINGFRASIASSFYWYDLQREKQTNLLIHPFCFMDANSFYEQKQNPDQTSNELMHYLSEVKKVKGTLITIWHNNFFGTDTIFEGWKEVYERFLNKL